jgi:tryptophan synthase alpha chain
MNPIQELMNRKRENLLSLFFTAGFPEKESTTAIIEAAAREGIDFLEVGMPYSDPLADGPVIQQSSALAIENGMNIPLLFEQLESIKGKYDIPLLLMGYLNPVIQYGPKEFAEKAAQCGVSGIILPDLPLREYLEEYHDLFSANNLNMVFLITPQTPDDRIRMIDDVSKAFIYVVSSAATTGSKQDFEKSHEDYFSRLKAMNLKNPLIAGFGIHNHQTLQQAWKHFNGAICGSAFIKKLEQHPDPNLAIQALKSDLGIVQITN